MVLLVLEAQTFISAVLYQKNKSFLPKVLYCTKKTKKTMFLDHWPRIRLAQTSFPNPNVKKPMFLLYSTSFLIKELAFFGTVQQK